MRILCIRATAILLWELTEPTPYGRDGDEGDGCDANLEEKLMKCVR
jgi:hypothetical protein